MTGNPVPWIGLIALVLAALAFKGYFRLPAFGGAPAAVQPSKESGSTYGEATPNEAWLLERLDSDTLGVYFALAKRREAEAELAHKIAQDAGDAIKSAFTAPFSPPAPEPAGPEPKPAGGPPQP